MKKALSVLLAALMLFSVMGITAAAEGETVKVTFKVDGVEYKSYDVVAGTEIIDILLTGDNLLITPTKAPVMDGETVKVKYTFSGWVAEDGKVYSVAEIPAPKADTVYEAKFTEEKTVRVAFYLSKDDMKDDKWYYALNVLSGVNFVSSLQSSETGLPVPTKASTETTKFTFSGWELYTKDASGAWASTGITKHTGNIPAASEDVCWVAVFAEENIKENQTLWSFIRSIFERINSIFEYFAEVFRGIIDFD